MQSNFHKLLFLAAPAGPDYTMFFMIALMLIFMYFFIMRPQQKKATEQKKFSDSITAGESIVTTSGIHGKINKINEDDTIQIEISRATFMTIDRSAVSQEMTVAYRKKSEPAAVPATTK